MIRQEPIAAPRTFSADLPIRPILPSLGSGADAHAVEMRLASMRKLLTGAVQNVADVRNQVVKSTTLEGKLLEKRFSLKKIAASVGMYLDQGWRKKLFDKLDALLDAEDWQEDFRFPSEESFSTFLRMIIFLHPTRRPGLGMSSKGHFLASWHHETNRLVVECLGKDEVRWVLFRPHESAAGKTQIHRIPDVTAPYEPDDFFIANDKLLS
jgi:hypothetical protein